MADINNALAAQIRVPESGNALDTLTKLNQYQLGQQTLQHKQFLYDQGKGYDPGELSTLEEVRQKRLDNAGRIGNMLFSDQSPDGRRQAINAAKRAGVEIDPRVEQHLMDAPPAAIKQYGANMMQAAQPSNAAIEQTGAPSQNRAYGQRTGELAGGLAPAPDTGPASPPGSPPKPTVSLSEKAAAAAASGGADQAQLVQYRKEQEAAGSIKANLQQLKVDAARVRTGAGADKEQAARKWIVALGDTVPALKGLADKYSSATAAFESIDKNAGIVAREAQKSVSGTAASELDAISKSLVNTSTTGRGIDVNASQLIGLQNYNHARAAAAEDYYQSGTLRGFVTQFNKNAGPAAWIYMALPSDERKQIRDTLNKTDEGKRVLNSLGRQIGYIHQNKMDEGLE